MRILDKGGNVPFFVSKSELLLVDKEAPPERHLGGLETVRGDLMRMGRKLGDSQLLCSPLEAARG